MSKYRWKEFFILLAYCIFLISINWHYSVEVHDSKMALTSSTNISYSGFGLGASIILAVILLFSTYETLRKILAKGIKIPITNKLLGKFSYLLLLLPLVYHSTATRVESIDSGLTKTIISGYGGDSTKMTILWAAIVIMLFQFLVNISSYLPKETDCLQK
ncbi:hypothetical protein AAEX28_02670 [Lentisphaerota bacterium WC36G]|nr:hypothetical protein LJT99_05550 [Lentisphaerae bacterium WC36]